MIRFACDPPAAAPAARIREIVACGGGALRHVFWLMKKDRRGSHPERGGVITKHEGEKKFDSPKTPWRISPSTPVAQQKGLEAPSLFLRAHKRIHKHRFSMMSVSGRERLPPLPNLCNTRNLRARLPHIKHTQQQALARHRHAILDDESVFTIRKKKKKQPPLLSHAHAHTAHTPFVASPFPILLSFFFSLFFTKSDDVARRRVSHHQRARLEPDRGQSTG